MSLSEEDDEEEEEEEEEDEEEDEDFLLSVAGTFFFPTRFSLLEESSLGLGGAFSGDGLRSLLDL